MVEYDRVSVRYLLTDSPVEEQLRVVHALGAQAAAQPPGGRVSKVSKAGEHCHTSLLPAILLLPLFLPLLAAALFGFVVRCVVLLCAGVERLRARCSRPRRC